MDAGTRRLNPFLSVSSWNAGTLYPELAHLPGTHLLRPVHVSFARFPFGVPVSTPAIADQTAGDDFLPDRRRTRSDDHHRIGEFVVSLFRTPVPQVEGAFYVCAIASGMTPLCVNVGGRCIGDEVEDHTV